MKKKKTIVFVAVLLVLAAAVTAVILGRQSRPAAPDDTDTQEQGSTDAPEITAPDANGTDTAPVETDEDPAEPEETRDTEHGEDTAAETKESPTEAADTNAPEDTAAESEKTEEPQDTQSVTSSETELEEPEETDAPETAPVVPQSCTHDYASKVTKVAACTTDGLRTYTCTKCGDTRTETIPATGHTASAGWKTDSTSHWHTCSTCGAKMDVAKHTVAPASADGSVKCSVCGYLMSGDTPISDCNHVWRGEVSEFGDCSDPWFIYQTTCMFCGAVRESKATLSIDEIKADPKYHNTFVVSTDAVNHNQKIKCRNCGETYDVYYVPPKPDENCDHEFTSTITETASCTKCGTKMLICSKCGGVKTEIIPAANHKITTGWQTNGIAHWHICDICGARLNPRLHTIDSAECYVCGHQADEEPPDIECVHSWKFTKREYGDCCSPWSVVYETCSTCGAVHYIYGSLTESNMSAYDYHDTYVVSVDPANRTRTLKCRNCERIFNVSYNPETPILCVHNWIPTQVPACDSTRVECVCSICGKTSSQKRTATAHKYDVFVEHVHRVAINEYHVGHQVYDYDLYECSVCGHRTSLNEHSDSEPIAHTFTPWETISIASATTDNIRERHCTFCGFREREESDNEGNEIWINTPFQETTSWNRERNYLSKGIDYQFQCELYTKPWKVSATINDYRQNISREMEAVFRKEKDSIQFIWHDSSGAEHNVHLFIDDSSEYHILGVSIVINADETFYASISHGFYSLGSYTGPVGRKELNPGCSLPDSSASYDFEIQYTY